MKRSIVVSACTLSLLVSIALAAEPPKSAPSPEDIAIAEAAMKMGTPGGVHETLKVLAGKFDAEVEMRMSESAEWDKSKGTEQNVSMYDGRYVRCHFAATMMGMPYRGMSVIAFDNQKQKYVMTWIDSLSTRVLIYEGTADASGKTITFNTECEEPGTTIKNQIRQVLTIVDKDHHTMEGWETKKGKEFKWMSIRYKRVMTNDAPSDGTPTTRNPNQ